MRNKAAVALLHYSCPPVVGGVEEIIRQQGSLFHRYYHPVKVIVGNGGHYTQKYEVIVNPLLSSRNPEILKVQQNFEENRERFWELSDEIYRYLSRVTEHFDLLIAHNVLTMHYNLPLTYALHRLADEGSLRVISWNHDSPFFYENFPFDLNRQPYRILKQYNPRITYIAISESRREQFIRLYGNGKEIRVIPNGIDPIRFFRLDPTTVRVIRENNLFSAEFVMVQPSRLHPRKNIELSIRVVKALQDKGVHARFLLSGAYDPHEKKTVAYYRKLLNLADKLGVRDDVLIMAEYKFESGEKLTADRITIRDLYLIADILFMPSFQEGFGIPLLEAGMIKLPIFCSDIPPFRELGRENVHYFSLQDTPEQIAEQILQEFQASPVQKMYRNVINHYVWDNIYHRYLEPMIHASR